jgi:hypothetical protein
MREDARDVGGLGGAGIVEARLEDILAVWEGVIYDRVSDRGDNVEELKLDWCCKSEIKLLLRTSGR